VAPVDKFDSARIAEALKTLGQDPSDDLHCVYCERSAETWDHLVGLVKNSEFSGFGHQIANLVPSCKECNSLKSKKGFQTFLNEKITDPRKRVLVQKRLKRYQEKYAQPIDVSSLSGRKRKKEYDRIKAQIFDLMRKADLLADKLRLAVKVRA
jgi:hypothetical protein